MNMNDDITILDLFAIHAPKDIPEWFIPNMEPKPLLPPLARHTFSSNAEWLKFYNDETNEWYDAADCIVPLEFKETVIDYDKRREKTYAELIKWQEAEKIERIIQWSYHYAKLMIEQRGQDIKAISPIQEKQWSYGCTTSIKFPLPIHSIRMTGQSEPVKLFFTSCDTLTELAAVLTQYSNWTFSVENTRLMANSQEGIEISINEGEVTMSLQEMVPY